MNDETIIIESLAMDLKRVALGLHRGSHSMADRFKEEALKRGEELGKHKINGYLKNLLEGARKTLMSRDDRAAEDALMYSTLFQNYAIKRSFPKKSVTDSSK